MGPSMESQYAPNENTMNRAPEFSPFSPDPNYLASLMLERERPSSVDTSEIVSRILNSNSQRVGTIGTEGDTSASSNGVNNLQDAGNVNKFSPTSSHSSARSATPLQPTQKQDVFGFVYNRSAPPFVLGRSPSGRFAANNQQEDGIQDLNLTLASLDLNTDGDAVRLSQSTSDMTASDSSGSVQFKLSRDNDSPTT